jgi:KaiC/GvpD/RAD55 family RecA-like ATPase
MLILALVPAVSVASSNALSQNQETITTQATTTELYTYATSTLYETMTVTKYFYGWQQIGSNSPNFSLHICGQGAYTLVAIDATQGQSYHINWTTDSGASLDFYITTASFPLANDCVLGENSCVIGCTNGAINNNFPDTEVLYYHKDAAGSVDWISPSTKQVIAWLWNLTPQPVSGTFSIQTLTTATYPSISYATAHTTMLLALTTIYSQVPPTTSPQSPAFQMPIGNLGFLGIAAVVAVIAGVLIVARRRKPSVETALIQEPPATVPEAPKETVAPQPVIQSRPTTPQPVIPTKPSPPQPVIMKTPPIVSMGYVDKVTSQPVMQPKVELQPIISTGYVDLDKALKGGIPEAFAVVLVSPSYDERDLLLRKVVNSAISSGRLAILISNDISRTTDMASRYPNGFYALSPQADRISAHGPNLLKIPSIENLNEANISLGLVLRDVLAREKATKRVMIIDILSDLLLRYKSTTTRRWLTDFVGKRKAEGFTIIATLNPLATTKEEAQSIIDFFDGVIEIFEKPLMERSRRFLMIKKMYGQRYSEDEVLMDKDKLF